MKKPTLDFEKGVVATLGIAFCLIALPGTASAGHVVAQSILADADYDVGTVNPNEYTQVCAHVAELAG